MGSAFRQFGQISKVEDQADGTIMVHGIASSGSKDHVGEIITPDAMRAALPDYSKFPALREMHNASAAGRVTEAEVDGDGMTCVIAHVVDPVAITKVKTGVYSGFSIGGKVLKRDPTDRSIITELRLVEISLVDSPCNPDAVINMWKADMSDYTPTGDEVVAEAKRMAEKAGNTRFKDYLYKAREGLIAKAIESDLGGDEEEPATEEQPGETPAETAETAETVEADDAAKTDAVDPVETFNAALTAAVEKASTVEEPTEETNELADLGKTLDVIVAGLPAAGAVLEPLAKGMYSVSYLAEVLSSLRSLLSMVTNYGEGASGDSKVPTDIATAIRDLGQTLVNLAQEEVAVLLTSAGSLLPDIEIVELSALVDMTKANGDIMEKAGARHSKKDAEHIQKSHDHMAALGAKCDSGNCDDTVDKAALVAENERLAKALTDGAPQVLELTKRFEDTIEGLTKRLEQVESQPAAPKTMASTLRPVTKTEDVNPGSTAAPTISGDDLKKYLDELPDRERGDLLIRAALANPQIVQTARAAA